MTRRTKILYTIGCVVLLGATVTMILTGEPPEEGDLLTFGALVSGMVLGAAVMMAVAVTMSEKRSAAHYAQWDEQPDPLIPIRRLWRGVSYTYTPEPDQEWKMMYQEQE